MKCKHEWYVLLEKTTESPLEHAANIGANIKNFNGLALMRKHICIIHCNKCGKWKRFVEEI